MVRHLGGGNAPAVTIRRARLGIALGVLVLALSACGSGGADTQPPATQQADTAHTAHPATYTKVTADELATQLEAQDFPLINVHIPYEGEIAGTDAFIPYDAIAQHLDELPADKDAKIMLYCRSGHMSQIAAETLVGLGYSNIWELDGGMNAWQAAGHEIVRTRP